MKRAPHTATAFVLTLAATAFACPPADSDGQRAIRPAPAVAADPRPQDEVLRRAEADVTAARARLELVLAQRDARDRSTLSSAARRAAKARELLATLPADFDAAALLAQADEVLALAARHGIRAGDGASLTDRGRAGGTSPAAFGEGDRAPAVNAPTTVAERTFEQNRSSWREQFRIRADQFETELRLLREAQAATVAPPGDVVYPEDWPDRVARREAHRDGSLARRSWTGPDGQTWETVIYDIRDLTYAPPDFNTAFGVDPLLDHFNALDREALRQRSQIFSGTPEDLALGLPLLNSLGGIDPYAMRGPKYSPLRQQQVLQTLESFLRRPAETQIISIPAPPQ